MEWVSVEERLPEVAGWYSVRHDGPQLNNEDAVVGYNPSEGWLIPEIIKSFYHVTHWRPEPPEDSKNSS